MGIPGSKLIAEEKATRPQLIVGGIRVLVTFNESRSFPDSPIIIIGNQFYVNTAGTHIIYMNAKLSYVSLGQAAHFRIIGTNDGRTYYERDVVHFAGINGVRYSVPFDEALTAHFDRGFLNFSVSISGVNSAVLESMSVSAFGRL